MARVAVGFIKDVTNPLPSGERETSKKHRPDEKGIGINSAG